MDRRSFLKSAGLLAGAMYVDLPTLAQRVSGWGEARLRIGILSDIHITDAESTKTFQHALEYFRSKEADGVVIAGDMADWGLESQLKLVAETWYRVFPKDKLPNGKHIEKLFVYGNHDIEGQNYGGPKNSGMTEEQIARAVIGTRREKVWKKYFHEEYTPVYLKTVKGYHFVGAHWEDWSKTKDAPGFIDKNREKLTGERPFFYIQHAHPKGTVYGEWAWGQDDGDVARRLSEFPNASALSGHSHMPLNNEYDLWQGAFTSIGTSSLRYQYPMGARENASVDGEKPGPSQMKELNCSDGRHGMLLTVYDEHIVVERREFVYDQPVADNWLIPWPMKGEMSFEARSKVAPIPEFAQGDQVAVRQIPNGQDRYEVKQPQVEVSFPSVLKKRTGVRANDYEVQVEQQYVDVLSIVGTKRVYSRGCYLGEAQDERDVICLFAQSELPQRHRYRFVVRPCESFGKKGRPIYSNWQDPAK